MHSQSVVELKSFTTIYVILDLKAYKILLEQFPYLPIVFQKKLKKGGLEATLAKVLLDQGTKGVDVVFLLDEVYLQKNSQYQDSELVQPFQ